MEKIKEQIASFLGGVTEDISFGTEVSISKETTQNLFLLAAFIFILFLAYKKLA